MIGPLAFGALLVAVVYAWARGIDRAAVDDGCLPTPLPLALRHVKQLRRSRRRWPGFRSWSRS